MSYTSYFKTKDNPTVYGKTDTGQTVAFENEQQFLGSGGNFANVQTVDQPITGAVNFSQYKLADPLTFGKVDLSKAPTTIPADTLTNPITRGDIESLLAENNKTYKATLAALQPTAAERASRDRLLGLQQQGAALQTQNTGWQQQVQERPLDGTILRSGMDREISNIANGNTRESLVNMRAQGLNLQDQTYEAQNLANLQNDRAMTLQQLQLEAEQGRYNTDLAMKFNDIDRAEKAEVKKLILESGNTEPYVNINGTIYMANGYGFPSEADFQTKTGMTLQQAQAQGLVGKLKAVGPEWSEPFSMGGDIVQQNTKTGEIRTAVNVAGGGSGGIDGLFSAAQINATVNQIAGSFDNEPIVKDYNAATSQYQLMESLGVNSKSPGDDIAFIYAFAKIMDPNSVVREGEYATVQRYAQDFLTKTELNAVRLVKNENFLSTDAKQKLLTAAKAKAKVITTQYNSLYNQYQQRISNAMAGQGNSLTDYSQAYPEDKDTSELPPLSSFNFQLGQ